MSAPGLVDIVVNGEPRAVAAGDTVAGLLDALGTEPRGVAVAVDGEVVPRRSWGEATFGGGEHVEILSIAQGG